MIIDLNTSLIYIPLMFGITLNKLFASLPFSIYILLLHMIFYWIEKLYNIVYIYKLDTQITQFEIVKKELKCFNLN